VNFPILLTRRFFERELRTVTDGTQTHLAGLLYKVLNALQDYKAESERSLATLTILCERVSSFGADDQRLTEWVPSCLGAEGWLWPGQSLDLILQPYVPVRNLRWFVSGHPEIVVELMIVGNEQVSAGTGGTKHGDWQGTCSPATRIRCTLRRAR